MSTGCNTPYIAHKKVPVGQDEAAGIPVPCGKCPGCLKRRVSGWSFRMMQEDKRSCCSSFVTLTYDTESVPLSKKGYMVLRPIDVRRFFQRLRNLHNVKYRQLQKALLRSGISGVRSVPIIRYYLCGEYGTFNFRPHYHIILFNADLELVNKAWAKKVVIWNFVPYKNGRKFKGKSGRSVKSTHWVSRGFVHSGNVGAASVGYCLKYMMKPSRIPLHKNDDRIKEFQRSSKGLGIGYLTEEMKRWHHQDLENRMYCNIQDGKKIAMPRYYKDKLYTEEERLRIAYFGKAKYQKAHDQRMEELIKEYGYDKAVKMVTEFDKTQFEKMYKNAVKNRNI